MTAAAFLVAWAMLAAIVAGDAHAQAAGPVQLDYLVTGTGEGISSADHVAVDAEGNVHVAGAFFGQVNVDSRAGQTVLDTGGPVTGAFFAVYDSAGNLSHAHQIDAPADVASVLTSGIAVDSAGNTHITGTYQPSAGAEIFVAVYDPAGNPKYTHRIGGDGFDRGGSVAVDAMGNSHITGSFEGTVDFDPGPGRAILTADGLRDSFVATYDPNGQLINAFGFGGTSTTRGSHIALDGTGNVYVTGQFGGTVDFDPGPGETNLTAQGNSDSFVASYDAAGSLRYAHRIGGGSISNVGGIAVDAGGNAHVTGSFEGTVTIDPDGIALTSSGNGDVFVAVFDPAGNLKHAFGIGSTERDAGTGVATDDAGRTYISGRFEGTIDADPGAGTFALTSDGGLGMFAAVYGPNGNLEHAHSVGGSGKAIGEGLAVDTTGAVRVVGAFSLTVDFDPGPNTVERTDDTQHFFVAGYRYPLLAVCAGQPVSIDLNATPGASATSGDDVILGTPGADVIDGLGGDDVICGEGGNDTLRGGGGDDVLEGGDGDDTIEGSAGNDIIAGGAGNDMLFGQAGRDIMRGNEGDDTIDGGADNDRILGGIDNDTLIGGNGNDYLGGFGGNDNIDGGAGDDTVFGGFGADTIDGGDGNDTLSGLIGDDTINGGNGNDTLNGDRGNDLLSGGPGNDLLNGGNADDNITGGDGNDTLNGGRADDQLFGGNGTDTCSGNKQTTADFAAPTCEFIFGIP